MRGILFDLDGVLYVGDTIIPGAADTLNWVRDRGIPHLFVTNTSSRPRSAIAEKLAGLGIVVDESQLLTPAVAAAQWLDTNVQGALALFVPPATRREFDAFAELRETAMTGAGAVIVGDLGHRWDFATLNRAFTLLMQQPAPAFIALGMTRYWRTAEGLQLDAGPFVRALEYATGIDALVMGKPDPGFFLAAANSLGIPPGELVMVGDDIGGDIGGAQASGMKGVLVMTGKFNGKDLDLGIRPAGLIDSLAKFPSWWDTRKNSTG